MKIQTLAALLTLLAAPAVLAQERGRLEQSPALGPAAQRRAAPAVRPANPAVREAARPTPAAAPGHNLARVRSAFAGYDVDGDGLVQRAEALRQGVAAPLFANFDENGDGAVTVDEFILAYRVKLAAQGEAPAADLEAEATRIRAARRAQAADQVQRRGATEAERVRRQRAGEAQRAGEQRPATRPATRPAPERPAPVRPAPGAQRPAPVRPAPARPGRD